MGNTDRSIRTTAYAFLSSHRVATLATVDTEGKPNAATVFYIVNKDFSIYFMTRIESRKFRNLQNQRIVSMVVADEVTMETIQLRGYSERIEDFKEENSILTKLWTVDYKGSNWPGPAVKLYESGHSVQLAVVKVVPEEITYAMFQKQDDGRYQSYFHKII
jgi:general stress protein 26